MEKVRWGVLGTAGIAGSQTIPAMLEADNCALYAIAGRSPEKAEQFKAKFGFEKAYGSFDALLSDPMVEAVYIPLPNDLHHPWCIRALNAKKHVLCEKPLALNEAHASEMFDAAERNGVWLMEAYAYLHSPLIDAVKHELEAGVIGEIRYLESAFIGGLPKAGDYRWRREAGGGAAYDLGCYPLTMALWMLGQTPEKISATAQRCGQEVDMFASVLLTYKDGAIANLSCGMLSGTRRLDRFRILGTKGEIVSPVRFNQCGDIPYTVIHEGQSETHIVSVPNNYRLEIEQLGRCVRGMEESRINKTFSINAARAMDKILEEIKY